MAVCIKPDSGVLPVLTVHHKHGVLVHRMSVTPRPFNNHGTIPCHVRKYDDTCRVMVMCSADERRVMEIELGSVYPQLRLLKRAGEKVGWLTIKVLNHDHLNAGECLATVVITGAEFWSKGCRKVRGLIPTGIVTPYEVIYTESQCVVYTEPHCVVCTEAVPTARFKCGHKCCCADCYDAVVEQGRCPMCRARV